MKTILALLLCTFIATACNSSSPAKDECLKIYQEGIEKIRKANTEEEIGVISYDVAKKIVDVSKGPDGDATLSASDQQALQKAQQDFYLNIESRLRQINPKNN